MDLKNAESIWQLYAHLRTQYTPADRITFDPSLLFEELIGGPKIRTEQQQAQLREHWLSLRSQIWADGFFRFHKLEDTLPRWFCMANAATAVTILPDGVLTTCEIGCENMYYGDVRQGITRPEVLKAWRNCTDVRDKCKTCPYLPECTGFSLCEYEASDCRLNMEDTTAYRLAITVQKYEKN
jgi:radical SAM protein with 4Fe4S-binding SPASM domain